MSRRKLIALAASAMVTLAVLAPLTLGAALAAPDGSTAANQPLSIGVSQGADRVTVAVTNTSDGGPIEGANVTIDSDGNYSASGVTSAGGIAAFDAPNATVNATITAATNNSTVSRNVTLAGSAGEGPAFLPFGQQVSAYVHSLQQGGGTDGPMGLLVAAFAGGDRGPPEHAGPPDHAGPGDGDDADDEEEDSERGEAGPPDDAGPPEEAGPPDHAGPGDGDDTDEDASGPPDDAGPPEEAGPDNDEDEAGDD